LLQAQEPERWALQLRFTLADLADHADALELVPQVLASNPDRHQRLRCAGVLFARCDHERSRAEAEARLVAQDHAAPTAERADGYHALLRILEADQRWQDAQAELVAWVAVDSTDDRLNAWQVKVGNRLRRRD
jgi:hypothetical protein